ncbi:MAG: hypothetical protein Q8L14_13735 [Myxococcales bacterium]|nr:hypothetical protein [Myxococcales bacterium]
MLPRLAVVWITAGQERDHAPAAARIGGGVHHRPTVASGQPQVMRLRARL